MSNLLPTIALTVLIFLGFGEIFYAMLCLGISQVRHRWLLRFALVMLGPTTLIVVGTKDDTTSMAVLTCMFLAAYFGFPRNMVRKFVERRQDSLTSDIPFYDIVNHPLRTAWIVLGVYWCVLAFFLMEIH